MSRTARRPRPLALASAALALLTLTACGAAGSADATGTATGPVDGGTLTFALANDPISLNPQGGGSGNDAYYVNRQLVDSLVDQDPATGEIVPWLATDWEVSADSTTFTFTLRDGVTFSDGTAFTAESVRNTLDDVVAQGAKANWAVSYVAGYVSTEVRDAHTAVVTFDRPNIGFLQALAGPFLAPLADATLALPFEERATRIIGTGPFVLDSYAPDQEVVLTAREDYAWGSGLRENDAAPHLDGVVFRIVPEASVRTGALQSDQVDVIGGVPPTDQAHLEDAGFPLVLRANPGTTFGLQPYTEQPIVSEEPVRQAIGLALDRQELRDTVLTEDFAVSTSVLSSTTPTWVDLSAHLGHDLARAVDLLEGAGWVEGADGVRERDGERLRLTLAWQPNFVANQATVELVQQQLRAAGIEIELVSGTVPEVNEGEASGRYDLRFGNFSRSDGDVLRTQFHSELGRPYTAPDAELDALLAAQAAERDPAARAELLARAQEHILTRALYIPTFELTSILGTQQDVHGLSLGADSRLAPLTDAYVAGD